LGHLENRVELRERVEVFLAKHLWRGGPLKLVKIRRALEGWVCFVRSFTDCKADLLSCPVSPFPFLFIL